MTHIYTLVCVECHRGWPSETASDPCRTCGRPSEVRGRYKAINLRTSEVPGRYKAINLRDPGTAGFPGGSPVEGHP